MRLSRSARYLVLILLTLSLLAIRHLSAGPGDAPPLASYVLGPEDTIEVNVWTHGDLTRTVTVRPDGMVSFPPVGEVRAAGLTPQDLAKNLRGLLQQYVKNPVVTVVVVREKGKRVSILGQVRNPGHFVLREQARLIEAMAAAGGVTFAADLSAIVVTTRHQNSGIRVLKVNLERVLRGEDPDSNVLLQPNDVVYVPGTLRQGLEALKGVFPNVQIQIQIPGQGP